MKNLNNTIKDLKIRKGQLIERMEGIINTATAEKRERTDAEKANWNELDTEVRSIENEMRDLERQLELIGGKITLPETENRSSKDKFIHAVNEAREGRMTSFRMGIDELRADPLKSNTITQQNTQLGGISVVAQNGYNFLQKLGVKTYTGVKGQITLVSAGAVEAKFAGETVDLSTGNLAPVDLVLAPRRLGVTQSYTKEFLANVNSEIVADVFAELEDALWRRLSKELIVKMDTDSSIAMIGGSIAVDDIFALESGVKRQPVKPAFVTTPQIAAHLKKMATVSNVAGPVWEGNPYEGYIDGLPAFGTPYAVDAIYYGDWNEAAVAQFGDIEVTINPYTKAESGQIQVVVDVLADAGIVNPNAFKYITDSSILG